MSLIVGPEPNADAFASVHWKTWKQNIESGIINSLITVLDGIGSGNVKRAETQKIVVVVQMMNEFLGSNLETQGYSASPKLVQTYGLTAGTTSCTPIA